MDNWFDLAAGWLQEHLLIPLLYALDLMEWEDVSYGWALFAVYGAVQVAVTFAVCVPLERWRPVERWPDASAVWVDVLYTVISRVGILPLFTFVLFYRVQVALNGGQDRREHRLGEGEGADPHRDDDDGDPPVGPLSSLDHRASPRPEGLFRFADINGVIAPV